MGAIGGNLNLSPFQYWSKVGTNVWTTVLAGMINAITTFSLLFERSSHMSGRATDLGVGFAAPFIVADQARRTAFWEEGLIVLIIMASFVFGAVLGAILIRTVGFGAGVMIVAFPIALAGIMIYHGVAPGAANAFSTERAVWGFLLALPMGMQNALTSLTPIGRSTHVTGTLTDLGISIASHTHKKTIHLFARWAGFALGGAAGLWMFFNIAATSTHLLICATLTFTTGCFFAHPGVRKKLCIVIVEPGRTTTPVVTAHQHHEAKYPHSQTLT